MSTVPISAAALKRQNLLSQVVAGVTATNAQYASLFWPHRITFPLLYWGDPTTARFATFGVNPSSDEFSPGRWPNQITIAELDDRSVNYFTNPLPPDAWFQGYEDTVNSSKALNVLGYSFRHDTVHFDLSPRATIAMETLSKNPSHRKLFLQMVSSDLHWFLSALALCPNIKGALMSGTVTKSHYFDDFLRKNLRPPYSLKRRVPFGTGAGATALYDLIEPNRRIPVFFCRKSPSDRADRGQLLANEVRRTLPQLRGAGF